ncbi:MAG: hypothetical protein V5A64_02385 [Candidatus Thermoplasmatota archaeon]
MRKKFYISKKILFVLILLTIFSLYGTACSASIAENYAPIFYFEKNEGCYPVDASYHLDNSKLYRFNQNGSIVSSNKTELQLIEPEEAEMFFYDNIHGTIEDNGVVSHYKNRDKNKYPATVYYRTYTDNSNTVIQYWMFYVFNDGNLNQHEGDWELVQIVIPKTGSKWVAYSQHNMGQQASWDLVEHKGNHVKVYVAQGSHANYLRSYSGKLGLSSDTVADNGKVLKPDQYVLENIETQSWINFSGRWGEIGDNKEEAISGLFLGKTGPQGPKYRSDGKMWTDPVSWGENIPEASSTFFTLEWLIYNFVTIFLLFTFLVLALILFFIYRRHKKYGLGPRICSILYIDGINLKSIGNILCIIGIIVALVGLFNQWYSVSYSIISEGGELGAFETEGMQDLLTIDGLKGVQMTIPGEEGPMPMGSFILPFSLFIGIGLFFFILRSIGISRSKKLGKKYIWRGIKTMLPIIFILVAIVALGSIVSSNIGAVGGENFTLDLVDSFSSSPFKGTENVELPGENFTAQLEIKWGLGLGGQLLLSSGLIFIAAGIIEVISKSDFFETKTSVNKKSKKKKDFTSDSSKEKQKPKENGKPEENTEEAEIKEKSGKE